MNEVVIRYSKDAIKFLSKLDKKSVMRIKNAIDDLANVPPVGDIKIMQGYGDGRKRLRVGSWRVTYRNENDGTVEIIMVINIGNRGDIYK